MIKEFIYKGYELTCDYDIINGFPMVRNYGGGDGFPGDEQEIRITSVKIHGIDFTNEFKYIIKDIIWPLR